ncbi:MAG: extracellular solute-binding protein, partial [Roseburia sp.]|nr:extracellular solute-binding protein [Roseburia sp.]
MRRKEQKVKKIVALLVSVSLMAGGLVACGKEEAGNSESTEKQTTSEAQKTEQAAVEEEFTYPMAGDNEITIYQLLNANVSANYANRGDTEWAKGIIERTGIQVTWEHGATGEDYNMMLASGEWCDIIADINLLNYEGGPEQAFEDGFALPLNDIIDEYCPNLKAYLEANPDIDKAMKTDSGYYYCFPSISSSSSVRTCGAFIRKDWLEQLNLDVPDTIDEWHDVLLAFKEELGIVAPYTEMVNALLTQSTFAYAFGVTAGNGYRLIMDGDQVVFAPLTDNYKEFLTTMNQWYKEGLLDTDIAAIDGTSVGAKMISGEAGATTAWLSSGLQAIQIAGEEQNPEFKLTAVAVPRVDENVPQTHALTMYQFSGQGNIITGSCENIEAAARFLDWQYSEEGILYNNFGIEGVSYNMVDGEPVFTDDVLYNYPEGWSVSQSIARYALAGNASLVTMDEYYLQTLLRDEAKEGSAIWSSAAENALQYLIPPATLSEEESDIVAKYIGDIVTAVNEQSVRFILGTDDIEASWDSYVEMIRGMHVDEVV